MDEQFNYQGSDFTCQLLSNVIENVVEFVTNTGNNANIDIRGFTMWKQKKNYEQNFTPLDLWFQVWHPPLWAKLLSDL